MGTGVWFRNNPVFLIYLILHTLCFNWLHAKWSPIPHWHKCKTLTKKCVGWRRSWLRGSFATPTTLHGIPYTTLYVAPAAGLTGTWIPSVTTSNVMSTSSMAEMMSLSLLNVATMFSRRSLGLKLWWSTVKIISPLLLIDRRSLLGSLKKSGGEETEWLIKALVFLKLDQMKSPHKYFLSELGIIN